MKLPSYLTLSRHYIYYVRFPIPKHIHPEHKLTHIRVSLKTPNHREALYISYRLSYDVNKAIQHLYTYSNMNYEEIRKTIKDRLVLFVKEQKETRLKEGELCRNTTLGFYRYAIDKYPDYDFEKGFLDDVVMQNAIRNADKLFPEIELPPESERLFLKEFGRQYPKALQEILDFNEDPEDLDFSNYNTVSQPNKYDLIESSLENAIKLYMTEMDTTADWRDSTKIEKTRSFKLLYEILGEDFVLFNLDQETANKIKSIIISLPKNRNTIRETRDLNIRDACALQKENKNIQAISSKTANKYIGDYDQLCIWLFNHGYIKKNPFKGLSIKIKDNGEKQRDAFSIDEIKTILKAVQEKKYRRKGYQYWGVLLAIFTGARANEIAQLHIEDVKQERELYYIDINKNTEDKGVKTSKSQRIIPIHSYIIDKGFIEYLDNLKRNGHERVFPELKYNQKSGYGRRLSDWFNITFLVSLGLKREGLSLHSFRHSIVTELSELNIQDSTISKITGHSNGKDVMQRNYNHSRALNAMKDAIEKLPYL